MLVVEVATQARPQGVIQEYAAAYGELHGLTPQAVAQWAATVQASVGVVDQPGLEAHVTCKTQTEDGETYTYYGVSGVVPGQAAKYALDFTPWGHWRQLPVVDTTGLGLSTDQLAAHLLYEMTWHGWPQTTERKHDELVDTIEKIKRDFADHKSGDPLPAGYHPFPPKPE